MTNIMKRAGRKIVIAAVVFTVLAAFAAEARADCVTAAQNRDVVRVYYYPSLEEPQEFAFREIEPVGNFTTEQRAFIVYANLFGELGRKSVMPHGIELLHVFIRDTLLILNVSGEVMNYGGTAAEYALINMILRNAWDICGVGMVTLWIDGQLMPLPEGTIVFEKFII